MPLPKEYYNIVGQGAQTGIKTFPGMNPPGITYPNYHGMFEEEELEPIERGTFKDLAENLWGGAVSGLTWSAVDLQDKDWEGMNTMERTGWILGEGASLFAPIGPFGLLGKAGRAAARGLGNRFTTQLAKEAGELSIQQTDSLLKGVNAVAKKTGRSSDEIIASLDNNVQRGLRKTIGDDVGISWVNEMGIGGVKAAQAQELLVKSGSAAVTKAFKDQGVEIVPQNADYIASKFVNGLSEGRYVNDVAEWIERGVGGPLPEGVAKYLGMAAQDMLMMSIHSIGVGKIGEHLRGEVFDQEEALSHSAIMSLAFPAIRLVPWGGKESIQNGIKAYWRSYRNTNYEQVAKDHGDDVVRGMLSIMSRGQFKDLINTSKLGNKWIKTSDGTKYMGTEGIESTLFHKNPEKQMPMKHVYEILNKYKGEVGKELRGKWGKEYITDLAASAPRMGLGVLAMNHAMFATGMFNDMEGPELASHIFMSAIMTKGRGAWGRDTQRTYMADFTPYYEALNLLGAKPDVLQSRIGTYARNEIVGTLGASYATDPIGLKVEQTFDSVLNRPGNKEPKYGDFNPATHSKVQQFANVYNAIKKMRNPEMSDAELVDHRRMNKKALKELSDSIDSIEVQDGQTIKEIGSEGTLAVLTTRPAERVTDIYGKMIQEMSDTFEIGASFDPSIKGKRKISGSLIDGPELTEMEGAMTYNRVMSRLDSMGRAEITGPRQNIRQLKGTNEEINTGLNRIAERWMEVLDGEYGGKMLYNNPYDNPYIEFLGRASNISAKNFLRKVISGDTTDPDAGRLADSMANLFAVTDSDGTQKFRKSIEDYKFETPKNDKEIERLSNSKEILTKLFELMKQGNRFGTAKNPPKQEKEITLSEVESASHEFAKRFNTLPEKYRENFFAEGMADILRTTYGLDGTDARAVYVSKAVREENLGFIDADGRLNLPSRKHVSSIEPGASIETIDKANQALDRISRILGPSVIRSEFNVQDASRFETLTYDKIFEVDKAIGNQTIKDLLKNGMESMSNIQFKNSNLEKKLRSIQTELENAEHSFTTGNFKIKHLDEIVGQMETLKQMGVGENQIGIIENNISKINQFLARGTKLEDYQKPFSDNVLSIREAVQNILTSEVRAKRETQSIVNKIINLTMLGQSGGGLKKTQVRESIEDLNARLREIAPELIGKEKQFSEMISEYNEVGGWTKALDIVRAVNERVVGQVLSNSRNPIISETAKDIWDKQTNNNKIDHKHRTLQTIAKDYGLTDPANPNEINPNIVKKIRDISDPESVRMTFEEHVRDVIYDKNEAPEAIRLWDKFIREDSNILASALINGRLRNTARIKAGVLEFNPDSKFRSNLNDDFFDRIHIAGDRNDPYKVWHLDDTITIRPMGKNRSMTLDFFYGGDPLKIQGLVNDQLRISKMGQDLIKELKDSGFKISANNESFKNLENIDVAPLVYMRLSPGARMLFPATKENINKLNTDFESWYSSKSEYLNNKSEVQKNKFQEIFGDLLTGADTNQSLRLKMLLQHIDYTRTGQFDKWIQEFSKSVPNFEKIAKIESDLYKRGYLSDGGTTQRVHRKVVEWNRTSHDDPVVRDFAQKLVDNNMQIKTAVIADENFTSYGMDEAFRVTESAFDNRRISREKLETVSREVGLTNRILQSMVDGQIVDLRSDKYQSLNSSMLDGAKIVDTNLAKFLWAQKGGVGEWNGAKTVIYATGENSMLGKGFAVYMPGVSQRMSNRDINLLIGESSAKSFTGRNLDGREITPLEHAQKGAAGDWTRDIFNNISNANMMNINIEGLGVQFTSKNVEGINISSSMFDWQSPGHVKKAAEWMGLSRLVQERGNLKSMIGEGPDFIRHVFAEKQQEGLVYTEGAMGLTAKMIDYGVSSQNPLVKPQLDKLLRNEDYKMLTKVPNRYGEDNFIVPDIKGNLSNPVFAEIANRVANRDNVHDIHYNKAVQFGGIALPDHTARKKMVDLEQKIFVFRDKNGIDHVIQYDSSVKGADKLNFYSPFYESYDPSINKLRTKDQNGNTIDINTDKTPFSKKMITKNKFKSSIKKVLDEVADHVRDHNLDFQQVHQLLKGEYITTENGQLLTLSKKNKLRAAKYKGSLGASVNAIPKIAKDQPVMRIDRVNGDDMNGVVQVNAHDLRTTLQRDNDGDHLYTYLQVPHKLIKDYARDMGHKSDYNMFQKSIARKDINIFGLKEVNNRTVAGQDPSAIGFSQYSSKLSESKQAIGTVISSRRAMSWMENAGLEYNGQSFLRGFSRKKELSSEDMNVLNRMMDVFQNSVDIHGGYNRLMAQDALKNYFLWGDVPADYTPRPGSLEYSHSKEGISGYRDQNNVRYGQGTNKEIQRLSFDIIMKTMNKANMMANDTWDAAGSRSPEIWELKNAHADIKALFENPTNFVVRGLAKEISRLRYTGQDSKAESLTRELVSEYFQKDIQDVTGTKPYESFLEKLRYGKVTPSKGKWNFKNKEQAFEYSIGGKVLDEVMKKGIYNSPDYGDIDVSRHTKTGYIVRDIVNRVSMHKAFGFSVDRFNAQEFKFPDIVPETDITSNPTRIKKAVTRGVVRTALQKEYRRLNESLHFFSEEKFVNPVKLSSIESRKSDVADAIRILDKQAAQDMVIDRKNIQIVKPSKDFVGLQRSKKLNKNAMVYEIKGRLKKKSGLDKDVSPKLVDYEIKGADVDYGNLKPMGWFNKGDRFEMRKGRSYIVDRRPIVRESASSVESRYSEAWKEATGVGRLGARNLIEKPADRELFMYEAEQLRNFLDGSYSKTIEALKHDRHFSNEVWDFASARETHQIDSFMQRWTGRISGDGSTFDKAGLLMRYVLQPQPLSGKYISDGAIQMPYYRVNKRLMHQMFNWGLDNRFVNMEPKIKNMIQEVEKHYRGEKYESDLMIEGYKYMNSDGYNWSNLGKFGNIVKSLSQGWFATPHFMQLEATHNLSRRQFSDPITVRTAGGERMRIKQKIPDNVFDKESANGKGCLY